MIATLLDGFKAAALRRSGARFTRKTLAQFKRTVASLKRGDMVSARVMASRDLETWSMWLDAVDAQRSVQALINADLSTMIER